MNLNRSNRRTALRLLGVCGFVGMARAQPRFPDRPITLLVPFAPGGIADLTARAVARQMALSLGQAVVVENRPSAGSIAASQAVAAARPDGHTLLLISNSNAVSATLFRKLPYETLTAFAPVSTLGFFELGVFVAANSRFITLADALAHARAQPGQLTIGTIALGSTQHLAAQLFLTMAGIDALAVPYKGTPAVLAALRAGEIDVGFEVIGPWLGQLKSGVLRLLALSSDRRNPALPEVPTLQQAGVPGYSVVSWNALAAPAGTPAAVMERLQHAAQDAVASAAVHESLSPLGVRLQASSPAQAQALLTSEVKRWAEVIRAAKIEPQ